MIKRELYMVGILPHYSEKQNFTFVGEFIKVLS